MQLKRIVFPLTLLMTALPTILLAESTPVVCTILPGEESASVILTNPFKFRASCLATCKFSTTVYDDNPQIICSKPVLAGQKVQMCILKAGNNKLVKFLEGAADCRKL
jgi:hypothetical protein